MEGSGEVIIFQNDAANDISFAEINNISGVNEVTNLDLGDVDSDGDMDVVVICKNSVTQLDEISWFRNDSILSFESEAVRFLVILCARQ